MDVASLIDRIDEALPDFAEFLRSDDNCFPLDTHEGIFAACTQYVRNRQFDESAWERLALVLNENASAGGSESEPACANFLETLAAAGHKLEPYLQGAALERWNRASLVE